MSLALLVLRPKLVLLLTEWGNKNNINTLNLGSMLKQKLHPFCNRSSPDEGPKSQAESTRDTYNYGQYINQFPPNTIKVIREFERIQKKMCRHKMSIMLNEIYIYIHIYNIYIYTYVYLGSISSLMQISLNIITYIYIYIYIYIITILVVTISLREFVADQIRYNLESAQNP